MKYRNKNDIFKTEYSILDYAENVMLNSDLTDNSIGPQFEKLYLGYKKLLNQSIQLVNIGDKQQERLLNLQNDLALQNRALEKEQQLASKVQANILPFNMELKGFQTGIYYQPANKIGGDFFDSLETNKCTHFLIGDISGHSTSSALVMAVCNGMLRSLGQTMESPLEIVTAANSMLSQILMDSGMFLTLAYMTLDRESNVLSVVSAGHNPVYLYNGADVKMIESTGPVLGWDPDDVWETQQFQFNPGSTLFLYTDGLVEAKNSVNVEFESKLVDSLIRLNGSPTELISTLLTEVSEFCDGKFDDDLTMFAIKRL
jgi:sigma-B regulation protein RsbU (phosphoserine phosphatase)